VDKDQVLETITATIRDELDDDSIVLGLDTEAADVEGWDSLAHVRIMIAVEQRFGIHFSTNEITSLKNVGALVDLIQSKL
jgi:acyl carrier protein